MTNDGPNELPPPCERVGCGMPLLDGEIGRHAVCPVAGLDDPGRLAMILADDRRLPRLRALQYRLACGGSFIDEGNPFDELA